MLFAWVDDEDTKRAADLSDDAYSVFCRGRGHLSDHWTQLLAETRIAR